MEKRTTLTHNHDNVDDYVLYWVRFNVGNQGRGQEDPV
jgi:hypothetical protein